MKPTRISETSGPLLSRESCNSPSLSTLNKSTKAPNSVFATLVALLALVLFLDILQMIMFCCSRLTPKTLLVLNVIQTAFWLGMLVLSIVGAARATVPVGVVFPIIAFLLYLGLLIYASVVFHRERKTGGRGYYAQSPKADRFDQSYAMNGPQTAYSNPASYNGAIPMPQENLKTQT
jgi:hypothetical protein